jgi:hypothetical protein
MISQNRHAFLRSLSAELDVQADRVRQLIGPVHWTTDGAHKEILLSSLLVRHVPSSVSIGRGFVISETSDTECSSEQDLLLLDTHSEAPLFRSGELVIAMPPNVMAAISVKSSFTYDVMDSAVAGLSTIGCALAPGAARQTWSGIYFFDTDSGPINLDTALRHICDHPKTLSLLQFSAELVIRLASSTLIRASLGEQGQVKASGYRVDGLCTGIFLGRLLSHLARMRGKNATMDAMLADLDSEIDQHATLCTK